MDLIMQTLEYNFDDQGNTECVSAIFNGNLDREYLNARVCVNADEIDGDIDDLSRKQLEKLTRARLSEITEAGNK